MRLAAITFYVKLHYCTLCEIILLALTSIKSQYRSLLKYVEGFTSSSVKYCTKI